MSVLNDASGRDVEQFWCLGDMVGYGCDPIEPLMFVKNHVDADDWVMGNHDAMLADLVLPQDIEHDPNIKTVELETKVGKAHVRGELLSLDDWKMTNSTPIQCIELNRAELDTHADVTHFWRSSFTRERTKPRRRHINGRDHTRVHASQHNPIGRYLYGWQHEILLPKEFQALEENRGGSQAPQTLWYGHTHVPTLVFGRRAQDDSFSIHPIFIEFGKPYALENEQALINPGSVGQPRDGDRRTAYAILDTDSQEVTFIRVDYPYKEMARRLLTKGYPESLARKLLDASPVKEMPEAWRQHHVRNGTGES